MPLVTWHQVIRLGQTLRRRATTDALTLPLFAGRVTRSIRLTGIQFRNIISVKSNKL